MHAYRDSYQINDDRWWAKNIYYGALIRNQVLPVHLMKIPMRLVRSCLRTLSRCCWYRYRLDHHGRYIKVDLHVEMSRRAVNKKSKEAWEVIGSLLLLFIFSQSLCQYFGAFEWLAIQNTRHASRPAHRYGATSCACVRKKVLTAIALQRTIKTIKTHALPHPVRCGPACVCCTEWLTSPTRNNRGLLCHGPSVWTPSF